MLQWFDDFVPDFEYEIGVLFDGVVGVEEVVDGSDHFEFSCDDVDWYVEFIYKVMVDIEIQPFAYYFYSLLAQHLVIIAVFVQTAY